jgi:hypothetical protein
VTLAMPGRAPYEAGGAIDVPLPGPWQRHLPVTRPWQRRFACDFSRRKPSRASAICRVTDNLRDTIALVIKTAEATPCTQGTQFNTPAEANGRTNMIWPASGKDSKIMLSAEFE